MLIQAANAKNRREDELPLSPELCEKFKCHMALFAPMAEAFPGMYKDRGSEMIKVDLEKAGIPFEDDFEQRIDFHGLRHTCGTRMARNGVPLAVAQKIMRHSTPVLTSGYYTHILIADKARELAKLPSIISSDPGKTLLREPGPTTCRN